MNSQLVSLPAVIDTITAQTLRSNLLTSYHAGASLSLDAADVERIGTPGLQLLWSAAHSFSKAGLSLNITNPSCAFIAAIKDTALDGPDSFLTDRGLQ